MPGVRGTVRSCSLRRSVLLDAVSASERVPTTKEVAEGVGGLGVPRPLRSSHSHYISADEAKGTAEKEDRGSRDPDSCSAVSGRATVSNCELEEIPLSLAIVLRPQYKCALEPRENHHLEPSRIEPFRRIAEADRRYPSMPETG